MTAPVGVVLAGGAGRRIGGAKATAVCAGRPLIAWPLAALGAVLADVAVVAKPDTALPDLGAGVAVWREPELPRHPLTGLVHALERAQGRAVLVCAVDLPLVSEEVVRLLAAADAGGAPAVVAVEPDGGLQPLLGRYEPAALAALRAVPPGSALRETLAALGPAPLSPPDPAVLLNVNTPADLRRAQERLLSRRSRTSSAPAARSPAR